MSNYEQLKEIDSKDLETTTGGADRGGLGDLGGDTIGGTVGGGNIPGFPRPTGPTFPKLPGMPGGGGQRPCMACGMG